MSGHVEIIIGYNSIKCIVYILKTANKGILLQLSELKIIICNVTHYKVELSWNVV